MEQQMLKITINRTSCHFQTCCCIYIIIIDDIYLPVIVLKIARLMFILLINFTWLNDILNIDFLNVQLCQFVSKIL